MRLWKLSERLGGVDQNAKQKEKHKTNNKILLSAAKKKYKPNHNMNRI